MELVIIVVVLALIEYVVFGMLVGRARGKYDCPAPATSGHPVFERYNRVQQNTGEQLIVFIPTILLYAYLGNPTAAAGLGAVFVVGRIVYLQSYVADPGKRTVGFLMGFIPVAIMLIATLISAVGGLLG